MAKKDLDLQVVFQRRFRNLFLGKSILFTFFLILFLTALLPIKAAGQIYDWKSYHKMGLALYKKGVIATNGKYALEWYNMAEESYTKAINSASSISNHDLADIYYCRAYVYAKKTDYIKSGLENKELLARFIDDFYSAMLLDKSVFRGNNSIGCVWDLSKMKSLDEMKNTVASGWCDLGKDYEKAGNIDKAKMCYERACKVGNYCCDKVGGGKDTKKTTPTISAKEWFDKGNNATDLKKKIEYYTKAIELNPNHDPSYNNRGVVYYKLGRYDKAISDYTRAIELNPKKDNTYINRGDCYGKLGRYKEAIPDYTKAIELNSKNANVYKIRGLCYGMIERYSEAISDYTRAIDLGEDSASLYEVRGYVYGKIGEYGNAISDYTRAIKREPDNAFLYTSRAVAYVGEKKYNKALKDFTKAISIDPKDGNYYIRGKLYSDLERYDEAIADYTKAINLDPKNVNYYYSRGNLYLLKLKKYEEAIVDYTKAVSIDPDCYQAYNNRAWVYYLVGRNTEALEDVNIALNFKPDFPSYLDTRANVYRELGKYEEAMVDINRAISIKPSYWEAYYTRGLNYMAIGEKDKAIADFEKACDGGSDNACKELKK